MLDKLIKRLNNGDYDAFEKIYDATRKGVYYVALSVLRERSLAEDVMQSTYIKVLKYASQYKQGTNASAWILTIAKNEALNLKKYRQREIAYDPADNPVIFGSTETDDYGLLIDAARKTLPQDEFTILMLIAACGYKRREIAAVLEMPISTVTWKYNNAIAEMRKQFTYKGGKKK